MLTKHLVTPGPECWYLQNCPPQAEQTKEKQDMYLSAVQTQADIACHFLFQMQEQQASFYALFGCN